jgi:exopolysaccharide production protein ExoZ
LTYNREAFEGREALKDNDTIDGIQVLRAVAAIMVVSYHAKLSCPGSDGWPSFGNAGVDIFFVISGFIMAYTTPVEAGVTPISGAWFFLRKRIARIVPMYWLALVWTNRNAVPDLGLLKDFFFIPRWSITYPTFIYPSALQGWTLNYEMFFYALFAIAILFKHWRTGVLVVALSIIPFASKLMIGGTVDVAGQFYSSDIIFEFGFGVILHLLISRLGFPAWPKLSFVALMMIGFALLVAGNAHEPRSLFQGLPAVLILWAAIPACRGWLRFKTLALLGNASYAMYLFHWSAFGLTKPFANRFPEYINTRVALCIFAGIFCGVLIHLIVERALLSVAKQALKLNRQVKLVPSISG